LVTSFFKMPKPKKHSQKPRRLPRKLEKIRPNDPFPAQGIPGGLVKWKDTWRSRPPMTGTVEDEMKGFKGRKKKNS